MWDVSYLATLRQILTLINEIDAHKYYKLTFEVIFLKNYILTR